MTRDAYNKRVLGADLFSKVSAAKVLCVGAGGIGCEVLKNLVLSGFTNIEIIDLDTIDLSNLNRQFLFQKQHVKRPKAIVAKETANKFNPHVTINALHANIKEPQFDVAYFKSFNIVINALDNMDARRHVNKMCVAANVPLVESGTAGFIGQVQPIIKGQTECYDCKPKTLPKSFPVCTIRSTPSTPIHCIVWAKSYLFPQLFGVDDESDSTELDDAAKKGENAEEIQELKKEAAAIKQLRTSLGSEGYQQNIFSKVYTKDIERLLSMEDMWKHRKPPTPLKWEELANYSNGVATNGDSAAGTIKDQKALSLHDSFTLFISSIERLTARVKAQPDQPLDWDKDDDDALDFATGAANLRAYVYGIPSKTRFDVKQMAGNIIPAIATTNAIISGSVLIQALNILRSSSGSLIWLSATRAMTSEATQTPKASCSVCSTPYILLQASLDKLKLGTFVKDIVNSKLADVGFGGDISVVVEGKILYEPDFEDNEDKSFADLGIQKGAFVTVNDEEGDKMPIIFVLAALPESASEEVYKLSDPLPTSVPEKPPVVPDKEPTPDGGSDIEILPTGPVNGETTSKKRKRAAEESDAVAPNGTESAKKVRFDGGATNGNGSVEGQEKGQSSMQDHDVIELD